MPNVKGLHVTFVILLSEVHKEGLNLLFFTQYFFPPLLYNNLVINLFQLGTFHVHYSKKELMLGMPPKLTNTVTILVFEVIY